MSFTYTGLPGVFPVRTGVRHRPNEGRVLVEVYQARPDDMLGLQNLLERNGIAYDIPDMDVGFQEITIERPQSASPATELNVTWDLAGNDVEQDGYTHESLASVDATSIGVLRRQTAAYEAGTRTYADVVGALTAEEVAEGLAAGTLSDLFITRVAGAVSFSTSTWVLRRTAKLGPNFPAQQVVPNVRKVWETTAELVAGESVPATRKFVLPNGQWLKRTPNYQQQSNGVTIYTQEWWWALNASTVYYPRAA